jgi:hypothetical protein
LAAFKTTSETILWRDREDGTMRRINPLSFPEEYWKKFHFPLASDRRRPNMRSNLLGVGFDAPNTPHQESNKT